MAPPESPGRSRDPAEHIALRDHAERIGVSGSWEWTPESGELLWSDNHFRLFGLEAGAIVPSMEFVLQRVHPVDRPDLERVLSALAAGRVVETFDYRVIRDDDLVRHLRATVAFVHESEGGPRRVVGAVHDVTSHDATARKLAAHAAVSKALDEWQEFAFAKGAEALLSGLAAAMSLPFGVLWVVQGPSLKADQIWHVESPTLSRVARETHSWRPGRGSATLGRAREGRRPVISNHPTHGGRRERAAAMTDAGIHAAIAIPAVAVDETLAVIEFLSLEQVEETDALLRSLNGIGHEVGYFLGQRRGQLVAPVLTPREAEVLQLAAHALSAAEIAREMEITPATVKRHFERAYASLGVSDRAAAVAQAMRQGLIV